jgi:hypothetical protein
VRYGDLNCLMQEHRQQQVSAEAEDSWDERNTFLAHVKNVLKYFERLRKEY